MNDGDEEHRLSVLLHVQKIVPKEKYHMCHMTCLSLVHC